MQLDRVMRTLCFMEELAGATEEQRLSRSVEVQDCVSEAKQRVEAGGSAGWEPARCLRNRWRATPEFRHGIAWCASGLPWAGKRSIFRCLPERWR